MPPVTLRNRLWTLSTGLVVYISLRISSVKRNMVDILPQFRSHASVVRGYFPSYFTRNSPSDWLVEGRTGLDEKSWHANEKRHLVEPEHPEISIFRQCELLGLPCSSFYYKPTGESEYNLLLMRIIDEQYTLTPFYGVPRMTDYLCT